MKRRMAAVAALLAIGAVWLTPAIAQGNPGSIEMTAPVDGQAMGASATITWTYTTGEVITDSSIVAVDAKASGSVYQPIGTAPITAGELAWDTTGWAEAATYTVRLTVVGTNKQATADDVMLDVTPPVLDIVVDPAACGDAWCNDALATVTVTASDAMSGLAQDPSGTTEVSAEGITTLSFTATDNAGNETTGSVDVRIDRTAPALSASVDPSACAAPSWCNAETATITVAASDEASGLSVDPSGAYTVSDEGARTLTFEAVDAAGNVATIDVSVQLDRTGPVTTIDPFDVPLVLNVLDGTISGAATDNLSGVASTVVTFVNLLGEATTLDATCALCPAPETTWSVSTASLMPGLYTVTATSTDVAGNQGVASAPVQVLIV